MFKKVRKMVEKVKREPAYICECGATISQKKDVKRHQLTQQHILKTHSHIWTIESASGPTSEGFCSICKEEKTFSNSIDTYEFGHGWSSGTKKFNQSSIKNSDPKSNDLIENDEEFFG